MDAQVIGEVPTKEVDAHTSIYAALSAAQGEIKNPEKTKEADAGKYKYKYADIGDVLEAVLPVLSRHGLSLTQPTVIREGAIVLLTRIHFHDEFIESEYPVCGLNGNHQAMGSAVTYARRYALTSLLGVAAVDDTDGQGAAPTGEGDRVQMTASQAKGEINWDVIQSKIDGAQDFATLTKRAELVEERKGFWPDTYYWKAKERIEFNRIEMATDRMSKCKTPDDLANEFEELTGILEGLVSYDTLSGIYRKQEQRFQ